MRKTISIVAPFDPITKSELDALRSFLTDQHYDFVFVYPSEEGILPIEVRKELLKRVLKPYRKMGVNAPSGEVTSLTSVDEEALVHKGEFYRIAPGIHRFILEKGYYLPQVVEANCSTHRATHSKSVAALCVELAKYHHVNPEKAYIAGMLHDITKNKEDAYHQRILEKEKPEKLQLNHKVWHSYTARYWLKENMGLCDEEILKAIDTHTIGDAKSKLGQILYIADKCEPTRGYDAKKELSLAKKDLQAAALLVLTEAKAYILEKEDMHV